MNKKFSASLSVFTLMSAALLAAGTAQADIGVGTGLRVGFPSGVGLDFGVGFGDRVTLRATYNWLDYSVDDIEDTDVTYDASYEVGTVSGFLDWHAFAGSFRFTVGAIGPGREFELDGTPAPGTTVDIGDSTYTAAQIGSLNGTIELGDSVAPYVGIGWGNIAGKKNRFWFLADVGVIFAGSPTVSLTATCGPTLTSGQCTTLQNQLRADIAEEQSELEEDTDLDLIPVLNIGFGIRF